MTIDANRGTMNIMEHTHNNVSQYVHKRYNNYNGRETHRTQSVIEAFEQYYANQKQKYKSDNFILSHEFAYSIDLG